MNEFSQGLLAYVRAWRLVSGSGLWSFLILLGLVSVLYFPTVTFLTWRYGGGVAGYIRTHWLPDAVRHPAVEWIVVMGVWVLAFYLGFLLFRNVIMVLYSPALSYLSGKT